MSRTESASAADDAPLFLWKIARLWLGAFLGRFGAPARIAQIMSRHIRRLIVRRVAILEALTMKLLLIEAQRLALKPAPPHSAHAHPRVRRAIPALDLAQPANWRVRFELRIPPPPRPLWPPAPNSGPRIRDLGPARTVRDTNADRAQRTRLAQLAAARAARLQEDEARERAKAARLARRVEALRRVLDAPARHARLLLRKLHGLQSAARAAAVRIATRKLSHDLDPDIAHAAAARAGEAVPPVLAALAAVNSS